MPRETVSPGAARRPAFALEIQDAALLVAKAHPHGLPQVRMLKLLWLAELRHFERTGERLTPAGWWRWQHGPYSKDVINTVKKATRAFRCEEVSEEPFNPALMIRANAEPSSPLNSSGVDSVNEVLWMHQKYTDEELLREIYADPFFEETPFSFDFDFSSLPRYRRSLPEAEVERLRSLPTKPVAAIADLFAP